MIEVLEKKANKESIKNILERKLNKSDFESMLSKKADIVKLLNLIHIFRLIYRT